MGEFIIGVFNTSVVMGVSIAAAGILLRVSRKRYSARCRKRIWIFMGFCLLIPFYLFRFPGAYTAEVPDIVLREFDNGAAYGAGGAGMAGGDVQSAQNQPEQNQPVQNSVPQGFGQGALKTELTVADVFFVVWICVAVLLAAWFAAGYWKMRGRIRRWSVECGDRHVQQIIAEVAAECKMKRIPEVRIMRDSKEGPFTTGVLRNIIILPDDDLHERDMRFILKHEAIHCRNHDISWRLFFLTVNIIHWFNPLVWYLRRAVEQDMEIACDEEVVARASREDRKEYGNVILFWVERSSYKGSAVSTGYVDGVRFLKRRFDSIFSSGRKKDGILLAGGVCLLALFIGCVIQLQSGGKVFAKKETAIGYGREIRTDVNGDGEADRVYVSDDYFAGIDSDGFELAETSLCVELGNGETARINYPDRWDSYLVTGDLTGNGSADIVLVKIAWGSTHFSGELTVLHVETDELGKPELVEYPSNFVRNPDLEPTWVDWENYTGSDEYINNYRDSFAEQPTDFGPSEIGCQGAAIIEKDGRTMLRLIYLVDGWTDSSQCIDCVYTEDGWYIEDMQVIYAYGGSKWEEELLGVATEPEDMKAAPEIVTDGGGSSKDLLVNNFWKTEETGNGGTLKFATGLEIIFPEGWQGKTVLRSADELDDTGIVAICEKGNAEAGIGGDLFYLYFFEYTEEMTTLYDWEKVLGLYRQGGREYVLVQDRPGDRCYSEDDQALIDAYLKLSETVGEVVIKTDNMPGFTKCGIEDLEWVQYEGDI